MITIEKFLLSLYYKFTDNPLKAFLFSIAYFILFYSIKEFQNIFLILAMLFMVHPIYYVLSYIIKINKEKSEISIILLALSKGEKLILQHMLKNNQNLYEVLLPVTFKENETSKEALQVCFLRGLKDKNLINLTQLQYTRKKEILKASAPTHIWNNLKKRYQKDKNFLGIRNKSLSKK